MLVHKNIGRQMHVWNDIQTRCANLHELMCMYLYLYMLHTYMYIHLYVTQCMHALCKEIMCFVKKLYFIHTIALCLLRPLLPFAARPHFVIWRTSCYFFWMVVIKVITSIHIIVYIYIYIYTHTYKHLYNLILKREELLTELNSVYKTSHIWPIKWYKNMR